MRRAAWVLALAVLSSSCSVLQHDATAIGRRVSPDYLATGEVGDLRAFLYGGKTVLDIGGRVAWLSVYDSEGRPVAVEQIGRYYRAKTRLDAFSVRVNLQRVEFKAAPTAPAAPVAALVSPAESPVAPQPAPVTAAAAAVEPQRLAEATETYAVLKACAVKLAEVRQVVEAAPQTDAKTKALRVRLEQLEGELLDATARQATLIVNFDRMSTTLRMTDATAGTLISAARAASRISLRGRTDSFVAGPDDARIAAFRAEAARDFLVDHGIDANRITVESAPAGEFLVPNKGEKAKALNRRVEIELRRETQSTRT